MALDLSEIRQQITQIDCRLVKAAFRAPPPGI